MAENISINGRSVIVGMTADTNWWQLLDNITTLGSLWFSVCCHMPK